jgi:dethiobiotin synthetase
VTILFITGTDTEVGKTVVTAALAAVHRARGRSVAVVKPAQTGVSTEEPGDLDEVRRLAGPVDVVEGIRLLEPLAPDRAAAHAGVALPTLAEQADQVRRAAATHDVVLVEGSGGVAVHLGESFTLLDLAAAAQPAQCLVVARSGLGTLNHATLTVDAIRRRGLPVAGLVIGSWPARPTQTDEYNRVDLPRYTGVPLLGAIPEGAGRLDPEVFQGEAAGWLPDQPA